MYLRVDKVLVEMQHGCVLCSSSHAGHTKQSVHASTGVCDDLRLNQEMMT